MSNALPPLILPPNSVVGNIGIADAQAASVTLSQLGTALQPSQFPYSVAGGSVDAITASYASISALYTGLPLSVGISSANATTTPTFTPTLAGVAQTTKTIKKYISGTLSAVSIGDLQGIVVLVYDAVNLCYVLMNPAGSLMDTIASATTPDIFAKSAFMLNYTGTATCTGFVAASQAGSRKKLICSGACLFTAGANLLIEGIPSGTTITLGANAICEVIALTTTQFKMTYTLTGTFTITGTGFTANPTSTAQYMVSNGFVSLFIISNAIQGTSNSTSFTLTGLPACIQSVNSRFMSSMIGLDNGLNSTISAYVNAGTITLGKGFNGVNFTNSGVKGLFTSELYYGLS